MMVLICVTGNDGSIMFNDSENWWQWCLIFYAATHPMLRNLSVDPCMQLKQQILGNKQSRQVGMIQNIQTAGLYKY